MDIVEAKRVQLAFVIDGSASMGAGIEPWQLAEYKWQPVVDGLSAFFEDSKLAGVAASLTVFPPPNTMSGGGSRPNGVACESATYSEPNLEFTELPSSTPRETLEQLTPGSPEQWPLGAQTWAALQATFTFVEQQADPKAEQAVVLIADGEPSSCEEGTEAVTQALEEAATFVPTYVVGVANPSSTNWSAPPDDLSGIAGWPEAGGSMALRSLQTDEPSLTASNLHQILIEILSEVSACRFELPAERRGQVDAGLRVSRLGVSAAYTRDEQCLVASGFRYAEDGTAIELCPSACRELLGETERRLEISSGCE